MLVLRRGYVAMRSQLARREEPEIAEGIREAFGRRGISATPLFPPAKLDDPTW